MKNDGDNKTILEGRLNYMKELICLTKDILSSTEQKYTKKKYRIFPHREFCIGLLLIANTNNRAAISIAEAGLLYPLHYICRNNLEVAVNMYYIFDPADAGERDKRLNRYKEFSNGVSRHKILEVIDKYPQYFSKDAPGEQRRKEIIEAYEKYKADYKTVEGKPDTTSWSGKKIPDLITSLQNKEMADGLMLLYKMVVQHNNMYLHPSWNYMVDVINSHVDRNVIEKQCNDRHLIIGELMPIFQASSYIIRKAVDNFSKNRPAFLGKLDQLSTGFKSYMKQNIVEKDK
jgi:hypothetical protein